MVRVSFLMRHVAKWLPMLVERLDEFIGKGYKKVNKTVLHFYRELLGFDHFIMRMQWPGVAQEMVLASIERLGRVVASIR